MKTQSLARNPFMLMLSPQEVIAAVERSEKLGRLNRRMCHPLDRLLPVGADPSVDDAQVDEDGRAN